MNNNVTNIGDKKERSEIKEKYLIKLDIDGTVTGSNGVEDFVTLNPKIEEIIKKLSSEGHIVCFSTGRNYFSALPIYTKAKLNTFLSTYNGAYINNPSETGSLVTTLIISNEVTRNILKEPIIKANIVNALIDLDDLSILCTSDDDHYEKIFFHGNPYTKLNSFNELEEELKNHNVLQMVLEFKNDLNLLSEVYSVFRKYKSAISFYPEKKKMALNPGDKVLSVDNSKLTIRIKNKYASKSRGAEIIASYYNIPLERTLAFGNEVNDIEIIKTVGLGIVTADSNAYLKTIAYDITSHEYDLNSDAVSEYLNKYFYKKP